MFTHIKLFIVITYYYDPVYIVYYTFDFKLETYTLKSKFLINILL